MALDFSKYTKQPQSSCDSCEFYDYDSDTDTYTCQLRLDEDEMVSFLNGGSNRCPYYRFYDEYKSVNKQI